MSAIQKYSEVVKDFEFCDDFGDGPLLMGHFTTDRSLIAVVSLLGGFIAMAGLGIPGALLVAFAGLNDVSYAGKCDRDEDEAPPAPEGTSVDGAIDVPAVTVEGNAPAIAAAPSMAMVNGVETIAPRDIATDLGNNPQSALIFGTPGAGKGMNISNAIRTLRAKLPNVTVMMVDPKGDKKERGYWESQVDIFESRSLLKSSPRSSAEWMMRCMEKYVELDGPKLLIWDELFATITVLKGQNIPKGEDAFPCFTEFQQFMGLHLSLGPSTGVWVWGMSQSANLSDLGLTSGGLGTTRIIALVSPDNKGSVEAFYATKAITAPKGGMDTIDRLMDTSPVGRACYDGKTKRWYPMARLENHSGFDRDNADWNNLGKTSPAPETSRVTPIAPPSSTSAPTDEPWESEEPMSERERIQKMIDSRTLEDWEALNAGMKPVMEQLEKDKQERLARERAENRITKIVEMVRAEGTVSVKDIQKKLKLDTSLEAQQLAQMFCMRHKESVRFKSKNNANSTVSYFIERIT